MTTAMTAMTARVTARTTMKRRRRSRKRRIRKRRRRRTTTTTTTTMRHFFWAPRILRRNPRGVLQRATGGATKRLAQPRAGRRHRRIRPSPRPRPSRPSRGRGRRRRIRPEYPEKSPPSSPTNKRYITSIKDRSTTGSSSCCRSRQRLPQPPLPPLSRLHLPPRPPPLPSRFRNPRRRPALIAVREPLSRRAPPGQQRSVCAEANKVNSIKKGSARGRRIVRQGNNAQYNARRFAWWPLRFTLFFLLQCSVLCAVHGPWPTWHGHHFEKTRGVRVLRSPCRVKYVNLAV